MECKILSIDAWREECGWTWNQWYKIDTIQFDAIPKTNRKILALLREMGILSDWSKGKCTVEDDGYNITIMQKSNRMPLYAIEYGNCI